MDNLKVVIVGGVAGGASAAARLRRLNESAEIIMLERSGYVSYANCGLPYYVGGTISDKGKLTLQDARSFKSRFNVDVRIRNEVVSIDTSAHKVRVRRLDDGSEYDESYDRLILSPGAKAIRPDIPGMDDERVMTLRTVEDALRIREFIVNHNPRRAVVAGGGYIGLEIAENLVDAGVAVTLVQRPGQVLPPLDPEMAMEVQAHIVSKGVDLRTEMLEIALCAQHNNGGLSTDLWWQTNVPGLYAAGEVAGTHGVYRPGGSALNAGQVGSMRAAQHIARFGAGEGASLSSGTSAAVLSGVPDAILSAASSVPTAGSE